jgi:hypothetical protein
MMRAFAVLAIWAACGAAGAQTIYKCTVRGKVSYGEKPCEAGTQRTIAVPEAPQPDPELAARLARQKALAESLEAERQKAAADNAGISRRAAAPAASPQQQRCEKMRLQLKWLEEDLRKTAGPATEPLRLKAQRQAEALAVECRP